jgi:hypothetical protein
MSITVNGKKFETDKKALTYDQVCRMGQGDDYFDDIEYVVVYYHQSSYQGPLRREDKVSLIEDLCFLAVVPEHRSK